MKPDYKTLVLGIGVGLVASWLLLYKDDQNPKLQHNAVEAPYTSKELNLNKTVLAVLGFLFSGFCWVIYNMWQAVISQLVQAAFSEIAQIIPYCM